MTPKEACMGFRDQEEESMKVRERKRKRGQRSRRDEEDDQRRRGDLKLPCPKTGCSAPIQTAPEATLHCLSSHGQLWRIGQLQRQTTSYLVALVPMSPEEKKKKRMPDPCTTVVLPPACRSSGRAKQGLGGNTKIGYDPMVYWSQRSQACPSWLELVVAL